MAKNRDFRVIKLAQKLCTDIVEMQGKQIKATVLQSAKISGRKAKMLSIW